MSALGPIATEFAHSIEVTLSATCGLVRVQQSACGPRSRPRADCGQPVPDRQRDDQVAINVHPRGSRHDQAAIRRAREFRDVALDLPGDTHADRAHLYPKRWCRSLDCGKLTNPGGYGGIPKDCRACHTWRDLFEQLQPFAARSEERRV